MRVIKVIAWIVGWLVVFVCVVWAAGALYFDFPIVPLRLPIVIVFAIAVFAALIFVRGQRFKLATIFALFAVIDLWWLTQRPSNDRPWQPDVAQTAWAEVSGDEVTLHNVRNCDYRTETDFTTNWETRTFRLSHISGLDIAIMYWGSPLMAHPIVSFRFDDTLPICFSIETRKQIGQDYSAVRGLYRQYALIYVAADERDSIRVRSNYRHGEDVYLYRTMATKEQARERFLEYINTLNFLHVRPRWYNAVTTNCTTSIRQQRPTNERTPWDWRIIVNGKGDELLYERHLIATGGLSFPELKEHSHINTAARAADHDPDFSAKIREGLPGFASE